MKRALVTGILGQDGSYMAELLASKGYEVHGIIKHTANHDKIKWLLGLVPTAKLYSTDISLKNELAYCIEKVRPTEIYNFAGVSDVFAPWENLDEILNLNAKVPQNILEIIVSVDKSIRFFQASSCLVFGKTKTDLQNELTPRCPIYVYGCAKNYSDNLISIFRETFGIFACSGVLYPHISPRQNSNFFAKKVCAAISRINNGASEKLKLGDLGSMRDWSYAPDVVEAAHLMLQHNKPEDFVIGSGVLTNSEYFVRTAFECCQLDYTEHIEQVPEFTRKKDVSALCADNRKIKLELKWQPKVTIQQLIENMVNYELGKLKSN